MKGLQLLIYYNNMNVLWISNWGCCGTCDEQTLRVHSPSGNTFLREM